MHKSPTDQLWTLLNEHTEALSIEYLSLTDTLGRFKRVLCPKATAVYINQHYLHANFVGEGSSSNRYIATQAPLPDHFSLFWQTAFNHGNKIIDLTQQTESAYYPELIGQTHQYGNMHVTLSSVEPINLHHFNIFHYTVIDSLKNLSKNILRLHFTDWADLGIIEVPALVALVDILDKFSLEGITCVHCRAGVGRTGTLITATILKEQILRHEIDSGSLEKKLIDLIIKLRTQRGTYFVETKQQFDLLLNYGRQLIELTE